MRFPGANADREDAAYVVVGAPLDVSTSFRPGARFGPSRIREFATPFEDFDHRTGRLFTDLDVHDHGDVRAWSDAAEYVDFLGSVVTGIPQDGAVPLLLGGEHTVSVAGVHAVNPDVYVCLDAHLDLRDALDGNDWSHATATKRALDVADEAIVLGARAGSEEEWHRAGHEDVTVVPPADVPDWEPAFAQEDRVYLSVDVDAADPGYAPGTGTPEPFGLEPATMRDVVARVAPSCAGFDVVEVNDRDDGQAASLAAKLLRTFVYENAHEG